MVKENELIKITDGDNGQRLVSAIELHEFLEIKSKFNDWFKRMCEYGFVENTDFLAIAQKKVTAQGNETTFTDYAIKIDMAKELSMIQRTEKGRQARQYFISCEKQLKEVQSKANLLLQIYNGGQEGILASKQLTEIEVKEATQPLLLKIEEDKPLVEFTNTVLKSSDNILVRELSKIAQEQGMNIGEKKLFAKLRSWGFLMSSNEPYQAYMKYFVVEEKTFSTPYGIKLSKTTKVNPRGQIAIIEKLKKEN